MILLCVYSYAAESANAEDPAPAVGGRRGAGHHPVRVDVAQTPCPACVPRAAAPRAGGTSDVTGAPDGARGASPCRSRRPVVSAGSPAASLPAPARRRAAQAARTAGTGRHGREDTARKASALSARPRAFPEAPEE